MLSLAAPSSPTQPSWWIETFLPWLTAVSTSVGVIAAILAGVYAARAFGRESRRDELREQEARRSQAEKISAWIVCRRHANRNTLVTVKAVNMSDQPVYQVSVREPGDPFRVYVPDADGGHTEKVGGQLRHVGVLAPGGSVELKASDHLERSWRHELQVPPVDLSAQDWAVGAEIAFRDARGFSWIRDGAGRLRIQP